MVITHGFGLELSQIFTFRSVKVAMMWRPYFGRNLHT
jgi:hypothetical protein